MAEARTHVIDHSSQDLYPYATKLLYYVVFEAYDSAGDEESPKSPQYSTKLHMRQRGGGLRTMKHQKVRNIPQNADAITKMSSIL